MFEDANFDDLTVDQIRNQIIAFKNDVISQRLANYYGAQSYSEILGVSRRELSHSRFIAWLLDDQGSHSLSTFPLIKFLEILVVSSSRGQSDNHKELFDSIITGDLSIGHTAVHLEYAISGVGRVDILVEADISYASETRKIRLVIENKVSTKEHSDQTTKYYDYFESDHVGSDIDNLYVYLTPLSGIELSELGEPECSCKKYIQINYQNIVDYILEPMLNKNPSSKVESILRDYLQSLSQPTQNQSDEHTQGLIMAIGNEERQLLTKFWDKNEKLILSALYAISSDPDQDKDLRDGISSALSSISGSEKDRSLLSIKYGDKVYADKIKKSDIGFCTVKLLESENLIDSDVIEFLKNDKSCSFLLIKQMGEVTETERKYSKYRVNEEPELVYGGHGYYIARNWGKNNIQKFIDKFTSRFDGLSFTRHE